MVLTFHDFISDHTNRASGFLLGVCCKIHQVLFGYYVKVINNQNLCQKFILQLQLTISAKPVRLSTMFLQNPLAFWKIVKCIKHIKSFVTTLETVGIQFKLRIELNVLMNNKI